MRSYLTIYSLVAVVVLASGCTMPNIFGGDVVSVQTKTVENGQRDVVVVKDVQTIPTSPLLPGQQLLLSFILENRDSLQSAVATVDLFNAPTMHAIDGTLCNLYVSGGAYQRYCRPVDEICGNEGCRILPGEEKPVNFQLVTPDETEIKGIKTDTKLNFKTTYGFNGTLNYIIPVVNMEEIVKRQRSGDKTELFITKSYGSGPVQIDASIQGAQYIISNLQGVASAQQNPETILLFTIKNRGSGTLVNSQIDDGMMTITFPPELELAERPNDRFTCVGGDMGTTVCTNLGGSDGLGTIPLYMDESRSSLRFAVRMRDSLVEPFRSLQITASVKYFYELRNSVDITVNPFQNV